ncbi:Tripartite ATP-independent periplasmic transporters, DctQ component [Marinomonas aquimarina]|uniref:TRAP transporter small permease protein n=1 Tax=Marinomonas aquimarina TaxID=295068 RepID=A0A1A8TH98_9GAMM|nr:TRAP transporter small permease [Marinomonas aquimarina]SBS32608.1 Tripartite ATP-independent periplasmic transporters, DctQ component [Marinomonas aquimarina]
MFLNLLLGCSRLLNKVSGGIAMLLIVYILGHILLEIVLRLFGTSTYVLDEFVGYAVATLTFLGLGYSLERGSLIRVGLIIERVPESKRWLFDLFATLVSFAMFAWIYSYWQTNVLRSFKRGTTSQSIMETPLWIPQGLVLVGLGLLCFTLFTHALILLFRQQSPELHSAATHTQEH